MIQLCAPWIGQNQLKAHDKSQLRRLVIQTTDSGRIVVGPKQKDGSCEVWWGGECRGRLMPPLDNAV